jgi:hypothetical protein
MINIMMVSIASMTVTQCSSVRMTTGSGTVPSRRGRCSGSVGSSANGTSRHEEEEIECKPADKEYSYGDAGDHQRAHRPILECLGRFFRSYRCGDMLWQMGG